MSARILLSDAFAEYVIDIIVPEGLFESFFAGRIDTLADKYRRILELDSVGV